LCNLYSLTKGQQAIREFARAMVDRTGNMPLLPGIFPDYAAPIIRNQPDGRELTTARWGMPSPVFALKGRNSDSGVTNVRNVKSAHWRRWLGVESRCVVPFTSFSENELLPDGSRPPVWFAFDETRPLAFFAGIWTRWTSVHPRGPLVRIRGVGTTPGSRGWRCRSERAGPRWAAVRAVWPDGWLVGIDTLPRLTLPPERYRRFGAPAGHHGHGSGG
jgi:putative SOS response-associated peptidase YedK